MQALVMRVPCYYWGDLNGYGEVRKHIDVGALLSTIAAITDTLQIDTVWSESGNSHYEIRMKVNCKLKDRIFLSLSEAWRADVKIEAADLCGATNCFEKTADAYFSVFREQVVLLGDRSGEGLSSIHDYCKHHCEKVSLRIAASLHVENLTPGEPEFWMKVLTWRLDKKYYGQQILQYSDGDHESGYFTCFRASPFIGPCTTREEVIGIVKNYQLV